MMSSSEQKNYYAEYKVLEYFASNEPVCLLEAFESLSAKYPVYFADINRDYASMKLTEKQSALWNEVNTITSRYRHYMDSPYELDAYMDDLALWNDDHLNLFAVILALHHVDYDEACALSMKYAEKLQDICDTIDFYQSCHEDDDTSDSSRLLPPMRVFYENFDGFDDYFKSLKDKTSGMNYKVNDIDMDLKFKSDTELLGRYYDWTEEIFKGRILDIMLMRAGIGQPVKTLEEAGLKYGLTRERIRQIELKTQRKMAAHYDYFNVVNDTMTCVINEKGFLTYQSGCHKIDKNVFDIICLFFAYHPESFIYDSELEVILPKDKERYERLASYYLNKFGKVIHSSKVAEYPEFRWFFEKEYKEANGFYLYRDTSKNNIFTYVIDRYFPDGIRIGMDEDYNKLAELFKHEYGVEMDASKHALQALLARENYVSIDRGTFVSREKAGCISDDVLAEILTYVHSHSPVIYYRGIFNEFEDRLESSGVNNWYYLKGLLDEHLPEEYLLKRDYISTDGKEHNSYEVIKKALENYRNTGDVFTFAELKSQFNCFEDYVIYFTLTEEQDNGLIWISTTRFTYKDTLTKEDEKELKRITDMQIDMYGADYISVKKVYAWLKLKKSPVLTSAGIESSYHLLYIMKKHFKNEYFFRNIFISRTISSESLNSEELLGMHVAKLDSFDIEDIGDYLRTMKLRPMSLSQVIEDYSDEFLLYDKGKLIRKEKAGITDMQISGVKIILNAFIQSLGEIDTRTYSNYSLFPKLAYSWNEYLLAGIIRTYLSESFEVIPTDKQHKLAHYIIRRKVTENE